MSHIRVRFTHTTQEINDILIATLSQYAFEGFEEENEALNAYVHPSALDLAKLNEVKSRFAVNYSLEEIPDTNWNQVWESNFQPVTVDDFCIIRADFHQPQPQVTHEIVITPKMSFGTGHHPTTYMMIRQMQDIDFSNKRVMDFGTGTGVLAILAGKLGASAVLAIDNDVWSIENARENFERNQMRNIEIKRADSAVSSTSFDIILANITRNVILDNFSFFANDLTPGGVLLLSGLLAEDEQIIASTAASLGLQHQHTLHRENWICLKLSC